MRALGDLRIWRGRHAAASSRPHDKALLDLIEPAFIAALRRARPAPMPCPRWLLSPREQPGGRRPWLRGLTDKQIARELGLSASSVRTYLNRLFDKTGTQRRAGLVHWVDAQRAGGGSRPSSD